MQWVVPNGADIEPISCRWSLRPLRPTADVGSGG